MADVNFSVDVVLGLVKGNLGGITTANQEMDKLYKSMDKASKVKPLSSLTQTERTQKLLGVLQQHGKTLNGIEKIYGKNSVEANKYFKQVTHGSKNAEKSLRRSQKIAEGFSFDFLGLMFGGMALQRAFGGMFKSMSEGYKSVTGESTEFAKKTMALGDSFSYLKFALFQGFAENGFVKFVIDGITWAIQGLADFMEAHPNLAAFLTGFAGALALLGSGLLLIGSVKQFTNFGGIISSLAKMVDLDGVKLEKNAEHVKTSHGKLSGLKKLNAIDFVVGAAIVFSTVQMFTDDNTSIGKRAFTVAGMAAMGARLGFLINGWVGAGVGGVIGLGVGIVLNIVDMKIESVKKEDRQKEILQAAGFENGFEVGSELFNDMMKYFYDNGLGMDPNEMASFMQKAIDDSMIPFIEKIMEVQDEYDNLDLSETGAIEEAAELRKELTRLKGIGTQEFGQDFLASMTDFKKGLEMSLSDEEGNLFQPVIDDAADVNTFLTNLSTSEMELLKTSLENLVPFISDLTDLLVGADGAGGLAYSLYTVNVEGQDLAEDVNLMLIPTMENEGKRVELLADSYDRLAESKKKARTLITLGANGKEEEEVSYSPYKKE